VSADPAADELARRLLDETREELIRADSKASLLLAAVAVVVGAVITGFVSTSVSPLDLEPSTQWLFWVGAFAVGIGTVGLGAAVWPRTGSATAGQARYYRDIVAYKGDIESLKKAVIDESGDGFERDTSQLLSLSEIVQRKYTALRVGMGYTALGAACCLTAWIINSAI
jgi:hypothetical protein